MKSDYVQVDETTMPVIDKESHKAAKEYLWMVRAVMERLVTWPSYAPCWPHAGTMTSLSGTISTMSSAAVAIVYRYN